MSLRACLCLAAVALAQGCSAGGGGGSGGGGGGAAGAGGAGGGAGGGGADAAAVCAAWARAVCAKQDSCSSYLLRGNYGDVATCEARAALGCVPWFAAQGSGVTADGTARCAAAYTASSCEDVQNLLFPLECRVYGTRANGAGCGDSAQCESGHCRILSGLCGTCEARKGAAGDCFIDSDCERGLVCGAGACVAPGGTGASCNQSLPCKRTHLCRSGQCARRLTAVGAACDTQNDDCDLFSGLWCNLDTARCQGVLLTDSGRCGYDGGTLTLCTRSADCQLPTGQFLGTCVAPAGDAQACTAPQPGAFACFSPGECVGGRCTLPGPAQCP